MVNSPNGSVDQFQLEEGFRSAHPARRELKSLWQTEIASLVGSDITDDLLGR